MKTRFAPSPTGPFHIGGLRTALLVKALAQKENGVALLRLEDTDTQRSTKAYEQDIIDSLSWAGLDFPTPYVRQSEKLNRYNDIIRQLLANGSAYYCYMTAQELSEYRAEIRAKNQSDPGLKIPEKYDNRYRPENFPQGVPQSVKAKNPHPVVRLKMPLDGATQWNDLGKGGISINNSQLDDLIIMRSDGSPTYNFVVVVDDLDMRMTHVIRGDDHISNTPKQIQISNILRQLPEFSQCPQISYCHIPLMMNPDGTKISKSALADPKNQEKVRLGQIVPAALADYKAMGILPAALVNYLLLISSQKTAENIKNEIFNLNTFIKSFNFNDLSVAAAKFDLNKLYEINFQYIQMFTVDEFKSHIVDYAHSVGENVHMDKIEFLAIAPEVQKRSKTLAQALAIVQQTIATQDNIKALPSDSFYLQLTHCTDHDSFKTCITQRAQSEGVKFGDIAKKLRIDLGINSGLPLWEIFLAIKNKSRKPIIS